MHHLLSYVPLVGGAPKRGVPGNGKGNRGVNGKPPPLLPPPPPLAAPEHKPLMEGTKYGLRNGNTEGQHLSSILLNALQHASLGLPKERMLRRKPSKIEVTLEDKEELLQQQQEVQSRFTAPTSAVTSTPASAATASTTTATATAALLHHFDRSSTRSQRIGIPSP
ncbi:hypothetical protein Cgig2_016849 [Carnegiea gigantea]|uniref:Uncharacterized protein n=1 Tax=Carnegiea gigantea TaxID=171969 RepID=A0A9Q1K645_9CARY|nr:hypothetical protein Cgig2_016849 [Carnegiea gigantea]